MTVWKKYRIFQTCLLISSLCWINPASAASELTLRVSDLADIISARASANAIDAESKQELLEALQNIKQELDHSEEKGNVSLFSTAHYPELHLLLNITRDILEDENLSFNQRDMLIQQTKLIIKKNKELDFSGEDYILSYHLFAKTISVEETYQLLSANAQIKLPKKLFSSWWDRSVQSVTVKKIDSLGRDQYKVWILYELAGGKKQCSEDWLQLIKSDSGWLIDDFYRSQNSVAYCESL